MSQAAAARWTSDGFRERGAQIAPVWFARVRWRRRYGLDDTRSTLLSLALVFLVLVFVYPLKMLTGIFLAWISGGWLPRPEQIGSCDDIVTLFIVFGLMFATLSWCIARLYARAFRRRREIGLDLDEAAKTAGEIASWNFAAMLGVLSILTALAMPDPPPYWVGGLPSFVYMPMNLTFWVDRRAVARARRRLEAEAAQ